MNYADPIIRRQPQKLSTIEEIILEHNGKYPLMCCQDYVKLVYQHFMGPGHLVRNPESALERLNLERPGNETGVTYENIGNGLVRCHLSGDDDSITNDELAALFFDTARRFVPDPAGLGKALLTLDHMAEAGALNVDGEEMKCFTKAYTLAGFPLVSHSERYHAAYYPSYRIIFERQKK